MPSNSMMRRLAVYLLASVLAITVLTSSPVIPAQAYPASSMGLKIVTTSANEDVEIGMGGTLSGVVINWDDSLDLTPTNVPNGTGVADTFYRHTYQLPGTYVVTISGTTMSHFGKCSTPLNFWNLEAVISWGDLGITDLSCAFWSRNAMTSVPSSLPSNVTSLSYAFNDAWVLDQNLNGWNTSSVTNFDGTFRFAQAFNNGGNTLTWNTSSATTMVNMFSNASAFDQLLSAWNVSAVTNMAGMLTGSGMSALNYSDTLIGWSQRSVQTAVTLDASAKAVSGCQARRARFSLISAPNNWTINDSSVATVCPSQTVTWNPTNTTITLNGGVTDVTPNSAATSSGTGIITYSIVGNSGPTCTVGTASGVVSSLTAGTCIVEAFAGFSASSDTGSTQATFVFMDPPTLAPANALPATGVKAVDLTVTAGLGVLLLVLGAGAFLLRRRQGQAR